MNHLHYDHRASARHAARLVSCVLAISMRATVAVAGESPGSPSESTTASDPRIEFTSTAASWDNLSDLFLGNSPAAAFGDGSVFVMRGELRNRSASAIHHVVLRYELLDANGKVVHDAEGYNRLAEAMRPDEEGTVRSDAVVPIAPGATDAYRMVFFHDEVPKFTSQRVRVVEVHEQHPAPKNASSTQPPAGADKGARP